MSKNARPCLPNPDHLWPAEDMRVVHPVITAIDKLFAAYPVSMDDIFHELAEEREAREANDG